MSKDQHLAELKELAHSQANRGKEGVVGCIVRHTSYGNAAWPDCDYRKNARDYSLANERYIYDVPNMRSPQRWLEASLGYGKFGQTNLMGMEARISQPPSPLEQPGCWNLDHTIQDKSLNPDGVANFTTNASLPYAHNTHHVVACAEVYNAFTFEELQILITAGVNIHLEPNIIILPIQRSVAWTLHLPAHCPDKANHNDYSERVRTKLSDVRREFQENQEEEDHEITEQNAPALIEEMKEISKEIRQYLIEKGNKDPGVNLDATLP